MRGNSFGKMITMTSFGESHGAAIGVVIDGVPAKLKFSLKDLQLLLDQRAPGKNSYTTKRVEDDCAEVLSGIFEDQTLGTPIAVIIRNKNQISSDYKELKNRYRPGHADKTTIDKFGIRDYRGGGRSSGRETIARVIGGYFASLILPQLTLLTTINSIGNKKVGSSSLSKELVSYLKNCREVGESVGGDISIVISGVPAGLGEPVFDKLKADLAKAMLSIGGCVSFSYGVGSDFTKVVGSIISKDRKNFGGIEGGISNGDDIVIHLSFKPPSTFGTSAKNGRHDPCIIPRVIPVVEGMAKLVIADHYLRQNAYEIKSI